jgi:hypothetical protein
MNLLLLQILVLNVVLNHKQQHHYSKLNRSKIMRDTRFFLLTFIDAKALFSTLLKSLNFVAPSASANKIH